MVNDEERRKKSFSKYIEMKNRARETHSWLTKTHIYNEHKGIHLGDEGQISAMYHAEQLLGEKEVTEDNIPELKGKKRRNKRLINSQI